MVERKHDNLDARDQRRQKRLKMVAIASAALFMPNSSFIEQKLSKPEGQARRKPKNSIDLELVFPDADPNLSPNTVGIKINNLPKGTTIRKGFEGEIYSWRPTKHKNQSGQDGSSGS